MRAPMDEEGIALFARPPPVRRPRSSGPNSGNRRNEKSTDKSTIKTNFQAEPNNVENGEAEAREGPYNSTRNEPASFRGLGLSDWLEKVCHGLGMKVPTSVQRGCIPAILQGRDVIGVALTGSGKTAAFALPILQKLAHNPYGVYALVMTPTRELAFQLADQFRALGSGMTLKDAVVVGGLDMQAQAKDLSRRPHIVVATPGRLRQLLDLDNTLTKIFRRSAFLVLDEADRLLEPTFESDLALILSTMPEERQTLLFSATMTNALITLQTALLRDAFHFQAYEGLQTVGPRLKEQYMLIPAKVKEVYLVHLLRSLEERAVRSAIVFASTCRGCASLAALLQELEIPAVALHSGLPQKRRIAALDRFKGGAIPIMLATDVASRGLDIPTVDLVINFDLPALARDYVHRVGRTARAERSGWALSFVTQYDIELVQKIEELTSKQMENFELNESEVLKGITQIYAARRAAALRLVETESRRKRQSLGCNKRRSRDDEIQN